MAHDFDFFSAEFQEHSAAEYQRLKLTEISAPVLHGVETLPVAWDPPTK